MIKHAKAKGSLWERDFAKFLRDSGIEKYAQRQPLSGAVSMLPGDIHSRMFTYECKSYSKFAGMKIIDQAKRAATATRPPVVALKTNNHKPIIIMEIDDWGEVMAFALKGGYGGR